VVDCVLVCEGVSDEDDVIVLLGDCVSVGVTVCERECVCD
jgi:hypothetical protein